MKCKICNMRRAIKGSGMCPNCYYINLNKISKISSLFNVNPADMFIKFYKILQ